MAEYLSGLSTRLFASLLGFVFLGLAWLVSKSLSGKCYAANTGGPGPITVSLVLVALLCFSAAGM